MTVTDSCTSVVIDDSANSSHSHSHSSNSQSSGNRPSKVRYTRVPVRFDLRAMRPIDAPLVRRRPRSAADAAAAAAAAMEHGNSSGHSSTSSGGGGGGGMPAALGALLMAAWRDRWSPAQWSSATQQQQLRRCGRTGAARRGSGPSALQGERQDVPAPMEVATEPEPEPESEPESAVGQQALCGTTLRTAVSHSPAAAAAASIQRVHCPMHSLRRAAAATTAGDVSKRYERITRGRC